MCTPFIFIQVLGKSLHITSEYLASEAKVESARSHASSLEAENSKLRKELIAAMDDANLAKEKLRTLTDELRVERELTKEKDEQLAAARERAKGLAAKAVEGFQQIKKYNTVLFSWYFKGFELLRRYFIKHPSGVDLEKLDLEEVDKEMAADKAVQSSAAETDALENAPETGGAAVDARTCCQKKNISFFVFCFFFFLVPMF